MKRFKATFGSQVGISGGILLIELTRTKISLSTKPSHDIVAAKTSKRTMALVRIEKKPIKTQIGAAIIDKKQILLPAVVRGLARYGHIVRVTFNNPCRSNFYEFGFF